MQLEGIDHVALAVRDVEQSAQWYIDILGFERWWRNVDDATGFQGRVRDGWDRDLVRHV